MWPSERAGAAHHGTTNRSKDAQLIFRTVVPTLIILWLAVGTVLLKNREGGCVTVSASGLIILASFCTILFMS